MAELSAMHIHKPETIYLKDYQAPPFFIDEINLIFELQEEFTLVKSKLRVRHSRLSQNQSRDLVLNGEELELESLKLNQKVLDKSQYELTPKMLIIHNVADNVEIEIVTKIYPQKNTALSGLYRSNNTYCTQCEAEGFRRITFFPDHPDILTRYTTTIIADEARYPILLSNGNLIDSGKQGKGKHWAKWEDPFKKPSYLFALVAGDFDMIEDQFTTQSGRMIVLRIYVEKGYGSQANHAMYALQEAMRWDEIAYGREYDLDVYMIVAISDFNMGAMENKGLNIFNTKYILAKPETATDVDFIHILSVVGHEYFHNWSGNRVTCRDWFQLSLKEGLTIFRDQSFSEDLLSHAVMRIQDVVGLRESQFPEDAGPLAHPVRPDSYIEINNFYTATVYNKGAEVLRMLQTILGKNMFRRAMDLYFARHDGQAVTIEDFIKTMEDVSGIDLTQFRLWYSQAGTPIVTVEDDYDPQQQIYTLRMTQTCPPTPGQEKKLAFDIPIKMGLLDSEGNTIPMQQGASTEVESILRLTEPSQIFQFNNIKSRPIPSLLRNFSAPIKLIYSYSANDLQFLFKHDVDAFNRWEAGQKFALQLMMDLVRDYQQGKGLSFSNEFAEMYAYILKQPTEDKYLLAEMIAFPSEKYIGEQMQVIDVDAIHAAREFAMTEIAKHLRLLLLETYQTNHDVSGTYQFSMEAVGKRQLKNRCLAYLMRLPETTELGMQQFEVALKINMTDTQAALVALNDIDVPQREKALAAFYDTWQNDALVVDKWFGIQALSKLPNTLGQIKKLVRHEAFDIKNPNKVYALIGSFVHRNAIHFHAKNGEGYAFLREMLQQLDQLNPQVAASLAKPLTMWHRYDKERQALMCKQLEILLEDNKLSPDLYELVSKGLSARPS